VVDKLNFVYEIEKGYVLDSLEGILLFKEFYKIDGYGLLD